MTYPARRCWIGAVQFSALLLGLGILVGGTQGQHIFPQDGSARLTQQHRENAGAIRDMIFGKSFTDNTADIAAQWYIYRVTWPENQKEPGKMNTVVRDFEKCMKDAIGSKSDQFLKAFSKKIAERAERDVLQNDLPIARVNGARILAGLADAGQPEVGDLLVKVLADPKQSEAVKLWALQGVKRYFVPPQPAAMTKDRKREEQYILALLDFVERKPPLPSGAPKEEVEAVRYLRRDALEALALIRYPAVGDISKGKGRTAQTMLRVARRDNVTPAPRLDEQVEAAIGVARLRVKPFGEYKFDGYQFDYAAHQLAQFIVEFADRRNTGVGRDAREPWKLYAARLLDALETLDAESRDSKDLAPFILAILKQARPILQAIQAGNVPNPADLNIWLKANPPRNKTVYRDVAGSDIKPPKSEDDPVKPPVPEKAK